MSQKPHGEETVARIRKLADSGMWLAEIARTIGLNRTTVGQICKRHHITTPRINRGQKSDVVEAIVPAWVPAAFRSEYRDIAREFGEEEAASAVRKLKAEAARC